MKREKRTQLVVAKLVAFKSVWAKRPGRYVDVVDWTYEGRCIRNGNYIAPLVRPDRRKWIPGIRFNCEILEEVK